METLGNSLKNRLIWFDQLQFISIGGKVAFYVKRNCVLIDACNPLV